jgi:hypothetical protein
MTWTSTLNCPTRRRIQSDDPSRNNPLSTPLKCKQDSFFSTHHRRFILVFRELARSTDGESSLKRGRQFLGGMNQTKEELSIEERALFLYFTETTAELERRKRVCACQVKREMKRTVKDKDLLHQPEVATNHTSFFNCASSLFNKNSLKLVPIHLF